MISGINEGYANFLGVQREATLNGAGSGTIYAADGKTSFQWEPVIGHGVNTVSLWRQSSGQTSATLHFQGSITLEYGHTELHRLLMEALLETVSTQADTPSTGFTTYTMRPRLISSPRSFRIGLEFNPGGPYYILHGAVIDAFQVTVRLHEIIKIKYDFKFCTLEDVGAASMSLTATSGSFNRISPAVVIPFLDGVQSDWIIEANFTAAQRMEPAQFGETKAPTKFRSQDKFSINGELVEYFRTGSVIPGKARNLAEGAIDLRINHPSTVQKLNLITPRVLYRSGTPAGVSRQELSYRASFDVQHDDLINPATEPRIVMVI